MIMELEGVDLKVPSTLQWRAETICVLADTIDFKSVLEDYTVAIQ